MGHVSEEGEDGMLGEMTTEEWKGNTVVMLVKHSLTVSSSGEHFFKLHVAK